MASSLIKRCLPYTELTHFFITLPFLRLQDLATVFIICIKGTEFSHQSKSPDKGIFRVYKEISFGYRKKLLNGRTGESRPQNFALLSIKFVSDDAGFSGLNESVAPVLGMELFVDILDMGMHGMRTYFQFC